MNNSGKSITYTQFALMFAPLIITILGGGYAFVISSVNRSEEVLNGKIKVGTKHIEQIISNHTHNRFLTPVSLKAVEVELVNIKERFSRFEVDHNTCPNMGSIFNVERELKNIENKIEEFEEDHSAYPTEKSLKIAGTQLLEIKKRMDELENQYNETIKMKDYIIKKWLNGLDKSVVRGRNQHLKE